MTQNKGESMTKLLLLTSCKMLVSSPTHDPNDNRIALQGLSPPCPCDPLLLPPLPPRCLWQPPPPRHHRQQETLQGGDQHLRPQFGHHWVSSGHQGYMLFHQIYIFLHYQTEL